MSSLPSWTCSGRRRRRVLSVWRGGGGGGGGGRGGGGVRGGGGGRRAAAATVSWNIEEARESILRWSDRSVAGSAIRSNWSGCGPAIDAIVRGGRGAAIPFATHFFTHTFPSSSPRGGPMHLVSRPAAQRAGIGSEGGFGSLMKRAEGRFHDRRSPTRNLVGSSF